MSSHQITNVFFWTASRNFKDRYSRNIQKQSQIFPPLFQCVVIPQAIFHVDHEQKRQSIVHILYFEIYWQQDVSTILEPWGHRSLTNIQEYARRAFLVREQFTQQEDICKDTVKSDKAEYFLYARNRKHSHSLSSVTCNTAHNCDNTYLFSFSKEYQLPVCFLAFVLPFSLH